MIALCTGQPVSRTEGQQIVASFPSGGQVVEIAMTVNQALSISRALKREGAAALDHGFAAPPAAQIVALKVGVR